MDTVPGLASFAHANDHAFESMTGPRRFVTGKASFVDLWDDVVTAIYDDWVSFTSTEERKTGTLLWEFGCPKKIAEVAVEATAFPTRVPHYYVVITCRYVYRWTLSTLLIISSMMTSSHSSPQDDPAAYEWVAKTASYIKKANVDKKGTSVPIPSYTALQRHEGVADVYGKNYARLRKLKAKYDPEKVWNKGYTISPVFE